MKFVIWLVVNAAALGVAVWLFDGITLTGASTGDKLVSLLVVGGIFGIISSLVKPVLKLLSLPLIVLTLGLFLLVLNALMLMLTSAIAGSFDLGFHVEGFFVAVLGAIVISLASMVFETMLPDRR
jgi:putative membrane protein